MQADTAPGAGAVDGKVPFKDCRWLNDLLCSYDVLGVCIWPESWVNPGGILGATSWNTSMLCGLL